MARSGCGSIPCALRTRTLPVGGVDTLQMLVRSFRRLSAFLRFTVAADERAPHMVSRKNGLVTVLDPESASTDETSKPRAFHVGLMRRTGATLQFKSAGVIGLSPDGGVYIAPMQPGPWRYGPLEGNFSALPTSAETPHRPKLHYHRSGRVYATLSGQDLERKSLQLTRLPRLRYAQIFSLHCIRTWELPTRAKSLKLGDQFTPVRRWPDVAVWTVFVLRASQSVRDRLLVPGLPSAGMLAGDGFTHDTGCIRV